MRALCFDYLNDVELFAVGDPEQAIFGWTGSRPELLTELSIVSGVHAVHLEHNYRCGAEIIRIANLIQRGQWPVTGRRDGGEVTATHCQTGFAEQCRRSVDKVQQAIARSVPLHEIVVICPTNDQCREVTKALRNAGVPAFVRSTEYRLTQTTSFVEACAAWAVLGRELSNYRLGAIHRRWRQLIGPTWTRERDVELTALLLDHEDKRQDMARELLADLLDRGLRQGLIRPSHSDEAVELAKMQHALTAGPLKDLTMTGLAEQARKVDRVESPPLRRARGSSSTSYLSWASMRNGYRTSGRSTTGPSSMRTVESSMCRSRVHGTWSTSSTPDSLNGRQDVRTVQGPAGSCARSD